MNKYYLRSAWLFLVLATLFLSADCLAHDTVKEKKSVSAVDDTEKADPTLVRAKEVLNEKIPEAWERYRQLSDAFLQQFSFDSYHFDAQKWEKQKKYNRWFWGISAPFFVDKWQKEWNEHPESRPAFALYLRDEIKKAKHLRTLKELSGDLDDETLFRNYLQFELQSAEESIQEQEKLEKELGIPEELKNAAKNPDAHLVVGIIYSHYENVMTLKKLAAQEKMEEAARIAARKAIVPVNRDSREYQKAFQEYKDAVTEQEQILKDAAKTDPTWNYSRDLILNGKVGESGFPGKQIDEFADNLNEEQKKEFYLWSRGLRTLINLETLEKEWNTKTESRPAIKLYAAAMLMKMKKIPQEPLELLRNKLQNGDDFYKQLILTAKENEVSLNQLQAIEKNLHISSKLKNAIERNTADTILFSIYDAYMRACVPNEFSDAEKRVKECVHRLNNLRPEWTIEEKIEFPDKFSWKMHQLGLDEKPQSMSWVRITCIASGIILIILTVILILRKKKNDTR
jgi:hypothetical protein